MTLTEREQAIRAAALREAADIALHSPRLTHIQLAIKLKQLADRCTT